MKNSIYEYDTMSDAKKIVAAMKKNSKEKREEYMFFKKKKDTYSYWLSWLFGIKFEVVDEVKNEEVKISIISWLNWWFGIKLDIISDEKENDNCAGLDNNEKQELRQGQTQNED